MKRSFRSKTRSRRYKKRNYRRATKRYSRKRYGNARRVMAPSFVFPNKIFTKLKFEEYGNIIHTDNSEPTVIAYRGNQPHKPNATGTGTSTGYGQFESAYERCTVIGSKMKLFLTDTTVTDAAHMPMVILNPELDAASTYDNAECRNIGEVKYAKSRVIEPSSGNQYTRANISSYMSTKTLYGVSGKEVKDSLVDFAIQTGSSDDPAKAWRWTIYTVCPWNADTEVAVQLHYRVTITYYCMFTQVKLSPAI